MAVAHTRIAAILLTWICSLSVVVMSQSKTAPAVGTRFAALKSSFEMQAETLGKTRGIDDGYNPGDVNSALQQTKAATLASIPQNDKPLRGYVERSFPEPVSESAPVAQRDEVEKRFGVVRELLSKLSHLDSFRLDLTVNTQPASARFELVPRVGSRLTSTTNSRLSNIYRGEYDYYVSKAGYKQIHETINFIERAGSTLECELQPVSGQEEALPCNFK